MIKSNIFLLVVALFLSENIFASEVSLDEKELVGTYYEGSNKSSFGIILLNGSSGSEWNRMAKLLNQDGYSVLALDYFGAERNSHPIPPSLEMVPLEYFQRSIEWVMNRTDTRSDGVIIIGFSKGAEAALLASTMNQSVAGVVALSPSAFVWSGIPMDFRNIHRAQSSWSVNGKGIPYIPYQDTNHLKKIGFEYSTKDRHIASVIGYKGDLHKVTINVEKTREALLISSINDQVWPSKAMGDLICRRMNSTKEKRCKHVSLNDQDHSLGLFDSTSKRTNKVYTEIMYFLHSINR